ncbi:MAG: LrgB family protein [Clostridia bacterium]|nr:LrgB family protein [Clostridia bacterium]
MTKEMLFNNAYFGLVLSAGGYLAGVALRKKLKWPILNPLLISIVICIAFLALLRIDYQWFNSGAQGLSAMITPCTVCLAVPLYRQFDILKRNYRAVVVGCVSGVLSSLICVWAMSMLFHFSHEIYVSLLPKSITTAIGMGVSEELGGVPNLTVAAIILTGLLGNIIASGVVKLFRIKEPVAVGLAIGSAAHALGTTRALEIGELEGAMSSLAISVCGLLTVVGASLFSILY